MGWEKVDALLGRIDAVLDGHQKLVRTSDRHVPPEIRTEVNELFAKRDADRAHRRNLAKAAEVSISPALQAHLQD